MPLMTKKTSDEIKMELRNRFSTLMDGLEAKVKKDDPIGDTYHEYWMNTVGSKMDIELAVDDFKTILDHVKKAIKN